MSWLIQWRGMALTPAAAAAGAAPAVAIAGKEEEKAVTKPSSGSDDKTVELFDIFTPVTPRFAAKIVLWAFSHLKTPDHQLIFNFGQNRAFEDGNDWKEGISRDGFETLRTALMKHYTPEITKYTHHAYGHRRLLKLTDGGGFFDCASIEVLDTKCVDSDRVCSVKYFMVKKSDISLQTAQELAASKASCVYSVKRTRFIIFGWQFDLCEISGQQQNATTYQVKGQLSDATVLYRASLKHAKSPTLQGAAEFVALIERLYQHARSAAVIAGAEQIPF
jgi:hypothetical protein